MTPVFTVRYYTTKELRGSTYLLVFAAAAAVPWMQPLLLHTCHPDHRQLSILHEYQMPNAIHDTNQTIPDQIHHMLN
jgi:hypothetical protein